MQDSSDAIDPTEWVLRRFPSDAYDASKENPVHAKAFANLSRGGKEMDGHSVSREILTSAEKLRGLAPRSARAATGVAALKVSTYVDAGQTLVSKPSRRDRGHCNAIGDKPLDIRLQLASSALVRIPPEE